MPNYLKRLLSSIILLPISLLFIFEGNKFFILSILFLGLISIYEWIKMNISKFFKILGIIFIIFSFYSFYLVRNISDNALFNFLIIYLTCISTDIGGFVFGKLFKGPKLTKISPKKTYAGVVGSYFFAILIIYFYMNFFLNQNHIMDYTFLLYILAISTISQLGDLTVSFFKRKSKIKDTGNIIPGHGGILDRIDGMIFAFPIIYLFKFQF